MKKMWKMRKDKSAVSPVIATILMVAITVVLAAVLYVMVMGFGSNGGATPTASLQTTQTSSLHYKVTVVSVSSNSIKYNGIALLATPTVAGGTASCTGITPAAALSTTLGAGDVFYVTFSAAGSGSVNIRDNATSNNIASLNIQVI